MFDFVYRWTLFWWAVALGIIGSIMFFALSYWLASPAAVEPTATTTPLLPSQ